MLPQTSQPAAAEAERSTRTALRRQSARGIAGILLLTTFVMAAETATVDPRGDVLAGIAEDALAAVSGVVLVVRIARAFETAELRNER